MGSLKEGHVDPLLVLHENTGGEAWGGVTSWFPDKAPAAVRRPDG